MNRMTTDIYFDLKDKDNDSNTNKMTKSLCKIHLDNLFLFQIYFKETKNHQVSQRNRTPTLWGPVYLLGSHAVALPAKTLASSRMGSWLQNSCWGSLATTKMRRRTRIRCESHLVIDRVTLDTADNNDNADNARLNITSSCVRADCTATFVRVRVRDET